MIPSIKAVYNLTVIFHRVCILYLFFSLDTECQCTRVSEQRVWKFAHIVTCVFYTRSIRNRGTSFWNLRRPKTRFYCDAFISTETWKNAAKVVNFTGRDHTNEEPLARSKAWHAHIRIRTNRSCRRYSNLECESESIPTPCLANVLSVISTILRDINTRARCRWISSLVPFFNFFFSSILKSRLFESLIKAKLNKWKKTIYQPKRLTTKYCNESFT